MKQETPHSSIRRARSDGDEARHLDPSADRHAAVAGVDPRRHLPRVGPGDPGDLLRVAHDRGAEDHAGHPRAEVPGRRIVVAHPAADLDRHPRGGGDAADDVRVDGLPEERAVEVDHVKPRSPRRDEPLRDVEGGVGEDRGILRAPLAQPDRLPVLDVDRRYHLERHFPTPHAAVQRRPKLPSSRSPAAWLFSGWNWTAKRFPRPHRGGERDPVRRPASRDPRIGRDRVIRMDEIEIRPRRDPLEDGMVREDLDVVPAHVRHLQHAAARRGHVGGKADHLPGKPADPLVPAELLALGEEQLHPHADPEERPARREVVLQERQQPLPRPRSPCSRGTRRRRGTRSRGSAASAAGSALTTTGNPSDSSALPTLRRFPIP